MGPDITRLDHIHQTGPGRIGHVGWDQIEPDWTGHVRQDRAGLDMLDVTRQDTPDETKHNQT